MVGAWRRRASGEHAVRVLLVDDDPFIVDIFRSMLDADDTYEVVGEAANGLEAVEVAASLQPDVVVLDLMMPIMSGADAVPRLREVCPGTRIVVVSARIDGEAEARAAGVDHFALKPEAARNLPALLDRARRVAPVRVR